MSTPITDSRFNFCLPIILKWEGGLVNNPNDPGGLTNMGISQREYPNLDIANLTVAQAAEIYYNDYWLPAGCALMPSGNLDLFVFNMAVNAGITAAIKILQGMIGVNQDGNFGPMTKAALQRYPASQQTNYLAQCALYYSGLGDFASFGKGWFNRLFAIGATNS